MKGEECFVLNILNIHWHSSLLVLSRGCGCSIQFWPWSVRVPVENNLIYLEKIDNRCWCNKSRHISLNKGLQKAFLIATTLQPSIFRIFQVLAVNFREGNRWIKQTTMATLPVNKPTEIQSDSCYFKPSSCYLTNILLSGHLGSGCCFRHVPRQ